jgi:hypothetical protein
MLLQTNSYIVPKDKRAEHARLLRRFRATLAKLGCDSFDVYEQVGSNWSTGEPTGRYVQIMRFRDRRHQVAVQTAERADPAAQAIIAEFCQLINFPYQQQQGLFAVGFYHSVLAAAPARPQPAAAEGAEAEEATAGAAVAPVADDETDEAEYEFAERGQAASAGEEAGREEAVEADQIEDGEPAHAEAAGPAPEEDNAAETPAEAPDAAEVPEDGAPSPEFPHDAAEVPDPDEMGEMLDAHLAAEQPEQGAVGDLDHSAEAEGAAADEDPNGLDALDIDLPEDSDDHADSPRRHVAR